MRTVRSQTGLGPRAPWQHALKGRWLSNGATSELYVRLRPRARRLRNSFTSSKRVFHPDHYDALVREGGYSVHFEQSQLAHDSDVEISSS